MRRAYKYVLDEPMFAVSCHSGPWFKNRWLEIEPFEAGSPYSQITVAEGFAWDGCSVVPDLPGTYRAACVHDAVYQFAEAIARETTWPVRDVLAWADAVFLEIMIGDGAKPGVYRLYYFGVRIFGYVYHQVARVYRSIVGRPLGVIKT